MMNRGIRGATTVTRNDEQEIVQETLRLLEEMVRRNELQPEYISNIWITMTQDLDATFPAKAIRQLEGWDLVPLMCSVEIPVQGSLPRCIRFMVQVNTDKSQSEIKHVYLNEAKRLRPDLSGSNA
ncbi:chorismate mutase [Paenibacillus sp. FSL W8-0187]|jgi:chorismate mutase|uniref:chorismate mutase n=1 Tax=Paenibacillus lautus TaxID=1401 RepID=A0A1R1B918_PAELA|nr:MULTISPECIES: chorismate mutase [Paenibacillus]MBY0160453.1 chorismate mutase [Cytobacillus firmus]MCV4230199.1 chorismate mutase [Virgibacillus sp. LDC1]VTR61984.1 Chorismate mutase AroH [Actinobacillus pleuropneumoniae]ACX64488.1 chorismate mutase [Paenibacillus sp. Y412MC10]AYB45174.1 chorismate mutase [Paenibacillus lautus]